MGKRIIARARGKGGPRYRAPSHRYLGKVEYYDGVGEGVIKDILHDPGRSALVMLVKIGGREILQIAPEGAYVGQVIKYDGEIAPGNVVELGKIPEGTKIFGIESYPGSGPKYCRAAGSFGIVIGKSGNKVVVQFSSGKQKVLDARCRATIGIPSNAGRIEKPWVKAGKKYIALHARGKLFPRTAAVVMNPVDHPWGGKRKRPRPSKFVSRNAPPGAKVGSISPKPKKKAEA
ncbi:MAG: 50S ribosomal protein L2 [Candidatus Aenigmarchaeota archaeon]|jgi:large subunit ribosomal protein L2|nr:50S ribosomal protein L2 [Candidatus Aenigmarchaeota archaeon]